MESGSPDLLPDTLAGQSHFDALVQATGCETSPNRLECLRHASFDVLKTAVDQTPSFLTFTVSMPGYRSYDGTYLVVRFPVSALCLGA